MLRQAIETTELIGSYSKRRYETKFSVLESPQRQWPRRFASWGEERSKRLGSSFKSWGRLGIKVASGAGFEPARPCGTEGVKGAFSAAADFAAPGEGIKKHIAFH